MFSLNPTINKSSPWLNEWVVVVFIWLLLALGEFVGVTQPLVHLTQLVVQPIQGMSLRLVRGISYPFEYSHSLYKAQRRIQDLELRYAEASALLGEIDQLKAENQALRELVKIKEGGGVPTQISRPILSYGHPLISSGSNHGIQTGQLILVADTLVGVIGDVSATQSEVTLLSRENSPHILVRTESGVQGLVQGDGKNVVLSEVPVEAELKEGERVTTVGQAGVPRDMLVGRIARVLKSPEASAQTAVIEQIVSFYEAAIVEIQ